MHNPILSKRYCQAIPHIAKRIGAGLLAIGVAACGSIMPSSDVGVSVSGVNYSEREIDGYAFFNPDNPKEIAGGEGLDPYSGGGIMCCYSLPKTWRPGIKVGLIVDNINGDGKRTKVILEVPPYPDDAVGDLWAIVYPDGTLGAVSTNFGPANEKWPGKIKGWPKPSLEYRRVLWERKVKEAESTVTLYNDLLADFSAEGLEEHWNLAKKYTPHEVVNFYGSNDPAYEKYLKSSFEKKLERAKRDLDAIKKRKP